MYQQKLKIRLQLTKNGIMETNSWAYTQAKSGDASTPQHRLVTTDQTNQAAETKRGPKNVQIRGPFSSPPANIYNPTFPNN